MRRLFFLSFLVILCVGSSIESYARQADSGFEFTYLLNWPPQDSAAATEDDARYGYDLLGAVDTLALGVAYRVEDDRPVVQFSLDWTPGAYGVVDNEKVPYDELPGELHIVAIDLSAAVYVEEAPVATMTLWLDSLTLAPLPEQYFFELDDPAWEAVFAGASAEDARTYFADGFTLRDLQIDRIAFATYEPDEAGPSYDRPFDPSYPTRIGVYPPHVGIFVDWVIWPRERTAGKRAEPAARPERTPRTGIGRTVPSDARRPRTRAGRQADPAEGRTTRTATGDREEATAERDASRGKTRSASSGKKGKDDDDEDDDEQLLPAALIGVAAVGVVAYLAGTVGYYGNTETPIGVTAGYVQPGGGMLLQVGINSAVLGAGDEPERLLGKVMGFYDVVHAPVQPAIGLGVLAEEDGDDIDLTPALSLGAVGNFGPVLLFGGYDLVADGVDFGIAINFRSRSRSGP